MNIREETKQMKLAAPLLAAMPIEQRNRALALIKTRLNEHREEIFEANRKDLSLALENHVAPAVMKRLTFDEAKLADVTQELESLQSLPDPIGKITLHRQLDEGLTLTRVTCPIGVIGVIFEARPDALVQISSLCLKSGNCAILKGGKETTYTNRILFSLIMRQPWRQDCLPSASCRQSSTMKLMNCWHAMSPWTSSSRGAPTPSCSIL